MKTGILLVNLGTPDAPTRPAVKKYLTEFLTDPYVIDIPWIKRQALVRGLIIPSRLSSSLKSYQSIWTQDGSPLLFHSQSLARRLQEKLGEEFQVQLAMRYQSPSIQSGLKALLRLPIKELIVVPLFPQYAAATTGSIFQKIFKELACYPTLPKLTFIDEFADHPDFIKAFIKTSSPFPLNNYDHILFSFHGLPKRQLAGLPPRFCYETSCYRTAQALAKALEIQNYSVAFQSRLGKDPWTDPFTSDKLVSLANEGIKKVLVFCPSFVADCLETIFEISTEYKELFLEAGGETLDLVPSLNDHPAWVDALESIICPVKGQVLA